MKTFTELGLSNELVSVLEKDRITTPTEIQEKTIPLVLAGKDVIGGSATGSGKTLAFASSIIEKLEKSGKVQALILTPTRELAEQVSNTIAKFSKLRKLNVLAVYGGVDIRTQIRLLENTDVVVGTPGRILDHLNRRTLNLKGVKFLVLDEVDRMFDMGFQVDVEKILKECPKERQTMLFSATISSEIDYLAKKYTKNPAEVSVESYLDASKLKQVYYDVPDGLKFSLFVHLLKKETAKLVMVFCATRRNVDFVANNLNNLGINSKAIHGGMLQNKRNKVMNEFNGEGGISVLVCTDVAARGLDIEKVSHVYNYDLPKTSGEYIHRIGRTARAGKEGIAISILASRDYENFGGILRDEKLKIKKLETPYINRISIIDDSRNRGGRYNSSRGKNFSGRRDNRPRTNSGGGYKSKEGGRSSSRGGSNRSRGNSGREGGYNKRESGRSYSKGGSGGYGRENNRSRGNSGRGGKYKRESGNSKRPSSGYGRTNNQRYKSKRK